jgi:hypothetical protein
VPSLASLTVAELDALAEAHTVDDYPSGGNKAEKVAALELSGVAAEAAAVYRLRLKPPQGGQSYAPAYFMADGRRVELTDDEPFFETADRWTYLGLRDLDFLEEVD